MANIEVNMNLKTRPAIYTPPVDRPKFGIKKNFPVEVDVLGLYQVQVEGDIDAYFVVTLPGGQCMYAGVDSIRFTDVGGA